MQRSNSKSYHWLLLASFVTVAACGSDDDGTGNEPSDGEPADGGGGGSADSGAKDGGMTQADAAAQPDASVAADAGNPPPDATVGPAPDAGTPDASGPTGPSATNGKALADELGCIACHRPNYAGATIYPNITSDMTTGIGGWTIAELANAIANGVGKGGDALCATMPRYGEASPYGGPISQAEAEDVAAYLKTITPVSKTNPGGCN